MPKSRRFKKVSLTKTDKKGLKSKQQLVEEIRKCVDTYESIYLFSVKDMRNAKLKDVRADWKDSRFIFGKNKVIVLGLGKGPEDEYQKNLSKLGKFLIGQCGLLFTNRSTSEVLEFFGQYVEPDYARAGDRATEDVILHAGPLPDFQHSLEPHLRSLGMPTALQKGIITLVKDYTVCRTGQTLRPPQAAILKLLGKQMAEFKIIIKCMWNKEGVFKKFKVKESPSSGPNEETTEDSPKKKKDSKKVQLGKTNEAAEVQAMDEDDAAAGGDQPNTKRVSKRTTRGQKKKNESSVANEMDVS